MPEDRETSWIERGECLLAISEQKCRQNAKKILKFEKADKKKKVRSGKEMGRKNNGEEETGVKRGKRKKKRQCCIVLYRVTNSTAL